jgi:hypothetical protein
MGLVVGCQFSDRVMASTCSAAREGQELWHVAHESDKDIYHLDVSGDPPAGFAEIRQRCVDEQYAEGGDEADVDLLFDAPLLLAKQMCGFKYDDESSDPPFAVLRPVEGGWAAAQLGNIRTRRSSWKWLVAVGLIVLGLLLWARH